MVIDLILDRKDGKAYNAREFYNNVMQYGEIGHDIAAALDGGTDEQVKTALCSYIHKNNYRDSICDYVTSVEWIPQDHA